MTVTGRVRNHVCRVCNHYRMYAFRMSVSSMHALGVTKVWVNGNKGNAEGNGRNGTTRRSPKTNVTSSAVHMRVCGAHNEIQHIKTNNA